MNCDFDVTVIRNYIDEYRKKGLLGTYYDFDNLRDFVNAHRRIYIYGSGVWGQITADYLDYKGLQYEGFVVTKSNNIDEREFRTVKINERDGVIIAQEYRDVCETIKNYVRDCVRDSQIFTPCYVEKI